MEPSATIATMAPRNNTENNNNNSAKPVGVSSVARVTPQRKHELLMEARKARISWVQSASFPFMEGDELEEGGESNVANVGDTQDNGDPNLGGTFTRGTDMNHMDLTIDPFRNVKSVCKDVNVPSVIPIIEMLLDGTSNSEIEQIVTTNLKHKKQGHTNENGDGDVDYDYTDTNGIQFDAHMAKTDDHAFLFYYKEVLDRLCLPECADIIQGMRHFERSFVDIVKDMNNDMNLQDQPNQNTNTNKNKKLDQGDDKKEKQGDMNDNATHNNNEHLKTLASKIQKYLSKLYDTLTNHPAWKDYGISSEIKMMLDTLIYAKCYSHIKPILSMAIIDNQEHHDDGKDGNQNNIKICEDEAAMTKRLNFLQFVEPKHLDMNSIITVENEEGETQDKTVDTLSWQQQLDLSKPISQIQSLDVMYSPRQLLRCIHEIYRGVNEALSACLKMRNDINNSETSTVTATVAPSVSADDILPSLILTVIHGKPNRIISVLMFLEMFATEEQFRGEIGYAYTQLYSAVQFVKQLDLKFDESGYNEDEGSDDDNDDGVRKRSGKPSLSMPKALLKEKLKKFREQMANEPICVEETENSSDIEKKGREVDETQKIEDDGDESTSIAPFQRIEIPISEVKAARLRGENIREWATQWYKENSQYTIQSHVTEEENTKQTPATSSSVDSPLDGLSISYKFLATDPEDVKVSDIPALLEEYKMLIRTTESLIKERNSFIQRNHQKDIKTKRKNLNASLEEVMKTSTLSPEKKFY